jgi:hypothetical protein
VSVEGMSWTCIEGNKESKARKRHSCSVCDSWIELGETQITRTGVDSDGWCRMHMHPECEEYSRDWDDFDWECSSGGVSREEVLAEVRPVSSNSESDPAE